MDISDKLLKYADINMEVKKYFLLLSSMKKGFIILEINDCFIADGVKEHAVQSNMFILDYSKLGQTYFQEIKNYSHSVILMYNCDFEYEYFNLLESLNLNRDNLRQLNKLIIFIMPTWMINEIHVRTPNLQSYISATLNFKLKYSVPFRPILSLDSFQITNENYDAIDNESNISYKQLIKHETNPYRLLELKIEECKHVKKEFHQLLTIVNEYNTFTKKRFMSDHGEDFFKFEISCLYNILEAFRCNGYIEALEEMCIHYLKVLYELNLPIKDNEEILRKLFIKITYRNDIITSLPIQKSDVRRVIYLLVYSMFYKKHYQKALDWLQLLDSMEVDAKTDRIKYRNDIIICKYKLSKYVVYDELLYDFKELSIMYDEIKADEGVDYELDIILNYNQLVLSIISNSVTYGTISKCENVMQTYQTLYSKESPVYAKFLSIATWVFGVESGNITRALKEEQDALNLKKKVFNISHVSLAETYYNNAMLYSMQGNFVRALSELRGAKRVLKKDAKGNRNFIESCDIMMKKIKEYAEINSEK